MTPTSHWNNLAAMLDNILYYVRDNKGDDEIIFSNHAFRIEFIALKNKQERLRWTHIPQLQNIPDKWKSVFLKADKCSTPMAYLSNYLNSYWKPWTNIYIMLDDIVDHIKTTKGNDYIIDMNVVSEDNVVKIEFISKLGRIWTCPINLLHKGYDRPERWKTVFLNMDKNLDPNVVLVHHLNNTWKNSSN